MGLNKSRPADNNRVSEFARETTTRCGRSIRHRRARRKGSDYMKLRWLLVAVLALLSTEVAAEEEVAPHKKPVKVVANARLAVGSKGTLPLYVSADWSKPLPDITRAVLVLHGRLRNADVYYRSAQT